jgi:hypothetical protein
MNFRGKSYLRVGCPKVLDDYSPIGDDLSLEQLMNPRDGLADRAGASAENMTASFSKPLRKRDPVPISRDDLGIPLGRREIERQSLSPPKRGAR